MENSSLFGDKEYKAWVKELKGRIRQSQIKASVRINSSMLELYWSIGADIVVKQAESKWGSGVIRFLSQELRDEFPSSQGFSETNLKYMKRFYLTYNNPAALPPAKSPVGLIGQQAVDQLGSADTVGIGESATSALSMGMASVPWGHHIEIFTHTDTIDEAMFYITHTAENGWSRSELKDMLKSRLYARQGQAPNNFLRLLPAADSTLAKEMLKDPYNFDFISLRKKYVEKELEDALVANVTKLLMEMGRGFSYLGRQVPILAGSKELFIDLLFYQVNLHCYVVVELKAEDFDAAHVGQLGTYVAAVNHQMRKSVDGPTIGLLICRSKDNVYAGYALDSSSQPIGVSSYELAEILPDEFKSVLPSIEDIEITLKDN